jgi:hypothetical protein
MFGRSPYVLIFALLILGAIISTAMPVLADENYQIDKDFQIKDSNIIIHVIAVNVTDKYMGNIYPPQDVENTWWAHLLYKYENTGNTMEIGHIQYTLIDSNGTQYQFNPNGTEYSGAEVRPHSITNELWNEIPIPAGTVLKQVNVYEGTNPNFRLNNETYDLPAPQIMTSTPTPTAEPSSSVSPIINNFGCCAPFLPFLLIGSLAVAGVYVKGKGIKK